MKWKSFIFIIVVVLLTGCDRSWNNPHHSKDHRVNVKYSSFAESPKTLDPARSYNANEYLFIAQIYEPPLQYHYLKRPYTLVPLTAAKMPTVSYHDATGKQLPKNIPANKVAYSVYDIEIKPGIYYQPHPAFAKNKTGEYEYHKLTPNDLDDIYELKDFKHVGTRELTAADYVYQIKRLAHPELNSPILGLMGKYIVGMSDYVKTLQKAYDAKLQFPDQDIFLDLRQYDFPGAEVVDRYHYRVKIKGKYPQFMYWLAMPFFAPIPWEVDYFYSQPDMDETNITFDWYPVGTGAYMMTENNPNRQMVLERNPNFHGEAYPTTGEAEDAAKGYLKFAGLSLPFIDKFIFSLEKETIPRWNKFLQGYYDSSAISSDSFDQAIQVDEQGKPQLTPSMQRKNIRLQTSVGPSIFYTGFNMLDNVVGGDSQRARKLRQAISIALDQEEFISIFMNGRGVAAQGPIPPGIFGYVPGEAGINPYVYHWVNNRPQRQSIQTAKKLLKEAGYPNGRDAKTGKPLVLNYDVASSAGPDDKARFDWMRKQFAKLGIQLNIRSTQYNRFQGKMRTGNAQIYSWGWNADYPDPENFLFLLYGPNSKVKYGGENASNYRNPQFDALFEKMKNMPNGPARQKIIHQMLNIVRSDAPWVWGLHPKDFVLSHQWNALAKPNAMANNTLKYQRLDPELRANMREQWNKAQTWPLLILLLVLIVVIIPVFIQYWRKQHRSKVAKIDE